MKNSLIGLLILAGVGLAQDTEKSTPATPPGKTGSPQPSGTLRRLEAVTWNPMHLELSWVVSVWDADQTDTPLDLERYILHLDSNLLECNGKEHKFDGVDQDLGMVLDLISAYSMRSTAWWGHAEQGASREADPNAAPDGSDKSAPKSDAKPDSKSDGKKDNSKDPGKKNQPAPKLPAAGKIALDDKAPPALDSAAAAARAAHDPLY